MVSVGSYHIGKLVSLPRVITKSKQNWGATEETNSVVNIGKQQDKQIIKDRQGLQEWKSIKQRRWKESFRDHKKFDKIS